ncbi:MAG: EcsC family protein [Deltaproteobacteria bacterium]|nr:EcsC family protein [Deltaproteobacteria bacterium]
MGFSKRDLEDLALAKQLLQSPSLAARLTSLLGTPIEKGLEMLPAGWSGRVTQISQGVLHRALDLAVTTLDDAGSRRSRDSLHRLLVAATGAGGGWFGLPALPIELPISTTIMLRSIADIARSEGESLREVGARLACVEVFALGGPSRSDDAAESGYFAVRAALAGAVSEAAHFITQRGLAEEGAPVLVRFVTQVAARFNVVVTEKAAAQAIPILGSAAGAAINVLFIDHFQDIARGHFIVRRLERHHGGELVQAAFDML